MPDWSYRTILRPILFRMSPEAARNLAGGFMGTPARWPLGTPLTALMGPMRPDDRLRQSVGGVEFPTRAGGGACVDSRFAAPRAFSRFGVAFLEVGPIAIDPVWGGAIERNDAAETLIFHAPLERPCLEDVVHRLNDLGNIPILVRLAD